MERILFVNACVRPDSRTHDLAQTVLSCIPGQIEEVTLNQESIPILDGDQLSLRNELLTMGDFSAPMFRYARQFAQADVIVIAAPYWDLAFPALLKIYLEAVTVTGVTFRYTEDGRPATLCRAKKLIYVTTAGGPILDFNFGFDYVSMLARGFYEIPEVLCVKAENLDIIGADVPALLAQAKHDAAELLK